MFKRFKVLAVSVLVAASALVAIPASAADTLTSTFLVDETTAATGYDKQSKIEITHPSLVYCSGSCSVPVTARYLNSNPYSSVTISMITNGGMSVSTAYLSSGQRTSAQSLTFYVNTSSNLDVTFHIQDTSYYKMFSGMRKFTRIQAGATPASQAPSLTWPAGTSTGRTLSAAFGGGLFRYLDVYLPDQLTTKTDCLAVPIWIQPIDISTGAPKNDSSTLTFNLTLSVHGRSTTASATDSGWNRGIPTQVNVNACGLINQLGYNNDVKVTLAASYPGATTSSPQVYANFPITGMLAYKSINCLKGSVIKTVTAANPSCPAGYSKTNIQPVNGHVPPSSISCVKGFSVKRVTGILPKCPAGWRKR